MILVILNVVIGIIALTKPINLVGKKKITPSASKIIGVILLLGAGLELVVPLSGIGSLVLALIIGLFNLDDGEEDDDGEVLAK